MSNVATRSSAGLGSAAAPECAPNAETRASQPMRKRSEVSRTLTETYLPSLVRKGQDRMSRLRWRRIGANLGAQ